VSFYVEAGRHWHGAPWSDGHPGWSSHGGSWSGGSWDGGSWDGCPYGEDGWHSGGEGRRDDDWRPPDVFHDRFRMSKCKDRFYRDVYVAGRKAAINIECAESARGRPTEIVGRLITDNGRTDRLLFRLDVDGKHGQRPFEGQVFYGELGRIAVEVRVVDFRVDVKEPGRKSRIEWIDFEVRAHAR
jgi:hypothetical protein